MQMGGLDNHKWCYMSWKPGDARITLDGDFKLIELWAIVVYIQGIRDQRKEG